MSASKTLKIYILKFETDYEYDVVIESAVLAYTEEGAKQIGEAYWRGDGIIHSITVKKILHLSHAQHILNNFNAG